MAESRDPNHSFSARQRWAILFNSALGVAAVLALVVMVNYLGAHYFQRRSWSANSRIALTAQTLRLLQTVTNRVDVTIFFNAKEDADLYDWVSGLLKEYRNVNRHIEVRTVDYTVHPGQAATILARLQFAGLKEKDFVLFECAGRSRLFHSSALVDLDMDDLLTGKSSEIRRKAFKGEWLFTSAIFSVAFPSQARAYFLTGHGEANPENSSRDLDYGKFADLLAREANIPWQKISLQNTNDIPADCKLLIVANPGKAALDTNEINRIDAYLRRGGSLFVMLNNPIVGPNSGIEKVLAKWGVTVSNYEVADPRSSTDGIDIKVVTFTPPSHPLVKSIVAEGLPLQMLMPRSVGKTATANPPANAPKVEPVAFTSTNAVRGARRSDGTLEVDSRTGQFPLIVAVEQGGIKDVSTGTRIVATGDQFFLNNKFIDLAANRYFAGFAINWLLDRPQILFDGIGPRPVKTYKLLVTPVQATRLQWLLVAGMPGAVIGFGFLVWLRRRS